MGLLNNSDIIEKANLGLMEVKDYLKNDLIREPFIRDFMYRFCWNSNSIEGNTLSLDETIGVIDYDEVRSGHTYSEYTEAKLLFHAIKEMMSFEKLDINENWILRANGMILDYDGTYRQNNLYVGTLTEAVYYPPSFERVPELMKKHMEEFNGGYKSVTDMLETIAREHLVFERIHPFKDGNGRTGRLLMNQRLVNYGWLPITIGDQSKYRQAFRRYDSSKDTSLLVHIICKGEISAANRVKELAKKLESSPEESLKDFTASVSPKGKKNIEKRSPKL